MFKFNLTKYFLIFNCMILSVVNLSALGDPKEHRTLSVMEVAARDKTTLLEAQLLAAQASVHVEVVTRVDCLERAVGGLADSNTVLHHKLDMLIAIGLTKLDNEVVHARSIQEILRRSGATNAELQANLRARIEATIRAIEDVRTRIALAPHSAVGVRGIARSSEVSIGVGADCSRSDIR